jgi:hypothetical protein
VTNGGRLSNVALLRLSELGELLFPEEPAHIPDPIPFTPTFSSRLKDEPNIPRLLSLTTQLHWLKERAKSPWWLWRRNGVPVIGSYFEGRILRQLHKRIKEIEMELKVIKDGDHMQPMKVTIRIPEALKNAATWYAHNQNRSLSNLFAHALKLELKRRKAPVSLTGFQLQALLREEQRQDEDAARAACQPEEKSLNPDTPQRS